jgi:hypothetical protein
MAAPTSMFPQQLHCNRQTVFSVLSVQKYKQDKLEAGASYTTSGFGCCELLLLEADS